MNKDYERMLDRSRRAQLRLLQENEDKGGWEEMPFRSVLDAIEHNTIELRKSLRDCVSPIEIQRRFANIANFAGMGIDNVESLFEYLQRG